MYDLGSLRIGPPTRAFSLTSNRRLSQPKHRLSSRKFHVFRTRRGRVGVSASDTDSNEVNSVMSSLFVPLSYILSSYSAPFFSRLILNQILYLHRNRRLPGPLLLLPRSSATTAPSAKSSPARTRTRLSTRIWRRRASVDSV